MDAAAFVAELTAAIDADIIDVKQRLAEKINLRWGNDFRLVAEEMPTAELPIAADWLEDRGATVAGKVLRTWRGLDEAAEQPKRNELVLVFGGIKYVCYALRQDGFRYASHLRRPSKRQWVRGGFKSVPLICVELAVRHKIMWKSYEVARTLDALSRQAEIHRIAEHGEHLYRMGFPPMDHQQMLGHIHRTTAAAHQHLIEGLRSYFWGDPGEQFGR